MASTKIITSQETYSLRHHVLRPNQELTDCIYPNDNNSTTFHLGTFIDDHLISIGSFYQEKHPQLTSILSYRLRGMATHPEYRGKKAASKILKEALKRITKKGGDLLWCNARIVALNFYKHNGFESIGKIFEINPIGPHQLMYIKFKN